MPSVPSAVRIRTSAGWQDIAALSAPAGYYIATVGDGSSTSITVTHNLGTAQPMVSVRETAGNQSVVYPEVQIIDAFSVRLIFDVAPTTGQYTVLVMGGMLVSGVPFVTSLPASPYDGQEVYYQADATNGINWHLRYRAGSANASKWEYLGGPPMFAEVVATEARALSTYGALTTAGPSITLARAGDYLVEVGCDMAMASTTAFMSYDIGATGAVDADAVQSQNSSGASTVKESNSRPRVKAGIAAATTLTAKYRNVDNLTNIAFANRWMKATPMRVA